MEMRRELTELVYSFFRHLRSGSALVTLLCIVTGVGFALVSESTLGQAAALIPKPPVLCIDGACPNSSGTSSSSGVKWHPGHYIFVAGTVSPGSGEMAELSAAIASICDRPNITGIKVWLSWNLLEGDTAGDYSDGFAFMDWLLGEASACDKRVIVELRERTYGTNSSAPTVAGLRTELFPAYIMTSQYGPCCGVQNGNELGFGGIVGAAPSAGSIAGVSVMVRYWVPAVMDRLIAMSDAYAQRYDMHPYFEMLNLIGETSTPPFTGNSDNAFRTQVKRWYAEAAEAWPHTVTRIGVNYTHSNDDPAMKDLLDHCASLPNCAVGGPDPEIGLPYPIQAQRVYSGVQCNGCTSHDYRGGELAWVGEVQEHGLLNNVIQTPRAVSDYYSDVLKSSYEIWLDYARFSEVIAEIDSNPSMGSVACPRNFPSCNRN